jgi:hypothetical protein
MTNRWKISGMNEDVHSVIRKFGYLEFSLDLSI